MSIIEVIRELSFFRLKRSVILGIKSLWMHKLRSLLTAMGIVFGVCSVIAMLAIGEGASYEAQQQIKDLGFTSRNAGSSQRSSRYRCEDEERARESCPSRTSREL